MLHFDTNLPQSNYISTDPPNGHNSGLNSESLVKIDGGSNYDDYVRYKKSQKQIHDNAIPRKNENEAYALNPNLHQEIQPRIEA